MAITKVVLILGFIICLTNQIASFDYFKVYYVTSYKGHELKTFINKCSCPMGNLYTRQFPPSIHYKEILL